MSDRGNLFTAVSSPLKHSHYILGREQFGNVYHYGYTSNDRFMYGNVLWYEMCYDESMHFGGAQYKQKGFTPLIILLGILIMLGIAGGAFYLDRTTTPKPSPVVTSTTSPAPKDASPVPNGTGETVNWKASCKNIINDPKTKYKECGMKGDYNSADDKRMCEEIGGRYISCASPCRHDPLGTMCLEVCVRLCTFQ